MKEQLQHIFQKGYPGSDVFIDQVIKPIFSDDVITDIDIDIIDSTEKRRRADNANILSAVHVADIDRVDSDPIALYDVTLKPGSKIEHSRVAIKQFIASEVMTFTHAFILFHYDNEPERPWRFSYVYKERTTAATRAVAKRYTYVFGKDYRSRTAVDRFMVLARSPKTDEDFAKAFSVEALSDEFFNKYRAFYAVFVEYITGERYTDEDSIINIIRGFKWLIKDDCNQFATIFESDGKSARDYIKKMFGRIIFLYFLQRKGWLYDRDGNKDYQYMHNLFANAGDLQNSFLDDVLEILFFYILNTDGAEQRKIDADAERGKDVTILPGWDKIPYLNGGLFSQDDYDPKTCVFPAQYFKELFDFLDSYNFTIDENDVQDAEIGIDPEMLGRIFENLLEDNKDKGAYYTRKPIVDFMCKESIISYLLEKASLGLTKEQVVDYVENLNTTGFSRELRCDIKDALKTIRICDPAIGSGAFPMGMVTLLYNLYRALGVSSEQSGEIKRHIMQNNVFGVDIEKGAVDIARLRFWLSMVVEEPNASPLPNLNFKVMQGNSLLESYKGRDLTAIAQGFDQHGQGQLPFGDSRQLLREEIQSFYGESDHSKSRRLLTSIKNKVITEIFEETKDENFLQDVRDVTENTKFFLWHTWFADVFNEGGFDIVIGNPPYITEGKGDHSVFEVVQDDKYYLGKMNIWYMFACKGIDMLKPNGILCFIATNNWVTSAGAKKLRRKIVTETQILKMCDFRDYMIFDTASIQTMIMQFRKNTDVDNYTFDLRNLLGDTFADVEDLLAKRPSEKVQYLSPVVTRRKLIDRFITFSATDDLLDKMMDVSNHIYLSSSEIAQGIVFPQDFLNKKGQAILGHHKVGDGIFGLSKTELDNLGLSVDEMELIKPYYTSKEIERYLTLPEINQLWLIYTDSSYKSPTSLDKYPRLKKHLDQFKEIFTSDNAPYGLHRARDQKFFIGEKILALRKCVGRPLFSFADCETYVTQSYNMIQTQRIKLRALCTILNSTLIAFWLKSRGKMQGLNFQLDKEPLQQIPIAVPSETVQSKLESLYEEIATILTQNLDADISAKETVIDHIVYHLYDLTYDEVLVVEPESSITREEYNNFNLDSI